MIFLAWPPSKDFLLRGAPMAPKKLRQNTIYVEFGPLRAGATGTISVTLFALFAAAAGATKLFGWW
jgi:hypothetical protein